MASINTLVRSPKVKAVTYEGAQAVTFSDSKTLRRLVLSCFLWEDTFYVDGVSIADAITELALKTPPQEVAALAIEARTDFHLRHVPLLLLNVLTKTGSGRKDGLVANTFEAVIQRPDEITEFLAIYQANPL